MICPFHNKALASYWLKVFALYAIIEACIQLLYFFILNNFGTRRISILEYHFIMLLFQCILIIPIWWVAWAVSKKKLIVQVLVNIVFYVVYSYVWFGPVQEAIAYLYNNLQEITRPISDRQAPYLDRGNEYSFLNYQLLKHAFRLSWFFLAAYFYNYRAEERKRIELAVANRELQLKLLKWHLNPSFYFKTINHLRQVAVEKPINTTGAILQLAKVMEYVIYEAKEKLIDVKKEIQFVANYIELINQQSGNKIFIEFEVSGVHDKLKIAPLLIAAFIDNMSASAADDKLFRYKMGLQFSGTNMNLVIDGQTGNEKSVFSLPDKGADSRIAELYPEKFKFKSISDNQLCNVSLLLDEY